MAQGPDKDLLQNDKKWHVFKNDTPHLLKTNDSLKTNIYIYTNTICAYTLFHTQTLESDKWL